MTDLPATLTDKQRECVEVYLETQSEKETAKALGLGVTTVRQYLWLSHKKGVWLAPDRFSPVAPSGFGLTKSTIQHKNGEVVQQWDRVSPLVQDVEDFAKFCRQRVPATKATKVALKNVRSEYLLEVPIYDVHHGMLAWQQETGNDYNYKVSNHLQVGAARILFEDFGAVDTIAIYIGGDNQHADNLEAVTAKSGNQLDTDSRYARIAWCTYETNLTTIEMAKQHAKNVVVFVVSGNHDATAAVHLGIELNAYFRKDKQVTIRVEPEPHKFYQWHSNAFCITHGNVDDKRIASYAMQQVIRRGYQGVDRVMVRMGHLHKRSKVSPAWLTEEDGVVIERFPTVAAQEAYSVEGAYTSVRATSAVLWHAKYGRHGGREVCVGEILDRYPLDKAHNIR
jgi:hypothetical protein